MTNIGLVKFQEIVSLLKSAMKIIESAPMKKHISCVFNNIIIYLMVKFSSSEYLHPIIREKEETFKFFDKLI